MVSIVGSIHHQLESELCTMQEKHLFLDRYMFSISCKYASTNWMQSTDEWSLEYLQIYLRKILQNEVIKWPKWLQNIEQFTTSQLQCQTCIVKEFLSKWTFQNLCVDSIQLWGFLCHADKFVLPTLNDTFVNTKCHKFASTDINLCKYIQVYIHTWW